MHVEKVHGGILYRGALSQDEAASHGRMVSAFRRYSRSNFFKPPMNNPLDSNSRVLKAWLADPDYEKGFPALENDYGTGENEASPGWGALAVKSLMNLSGRIDTVTKTPSKVRFLQSYPPASLLLKHNDSGNSSRIVGLAGTGEFLIYDLKQTNEVVASIPISPGDVLHFAGVGLHMASNPSSIAYRETLNLIDTLPINVQHL